MWLCRPIRFRCGSSATAFAAEAATPPASARPNFWSSWAVAMNSWVCLHTDRHPDQHIRADAGLFGQSGQPADLVEGIGHDAAHTGLKRAATPARSCCCRGRADGRRTPLIHPQGYPTPPWCTHRCATPCSSAQRAIRPERKAWPRSRRRPRHSLCVGSGGLPEVPLVQQEQRRSVFATACVTGTPASSRTPSTRAAVVSHTDSDKAFRSAGGSPIGAACEVPCRGRGELACRPAYPCANSGDYIRSGSLHPHRSRPLATTCLLRRTATAVRCSGASSSSLRGRTRHES